MEVADPRAYEGFLVLVTYVEEYLLQYADPLIIGSPDRLGDFRRDPCPVAHRRIPRRAVALLAHPDIDQGPEFDHTLLTRLPQHGFEGFGIRSLPVEQQHIQQLPAAVEKPIETAA